MIIRGMNSEALLLRGMGTLSAALQSVVATATGVVSLSMVYIAAVASSVSATGVAAIATTYIHSVPGIPRQYSAGWVHSRKRRKRN